jgi:hypothetical protein
VSGQIATVQIGHPGPGDDELDEFWTTGDGARMRSMYAELLAMQPIFIGYHKLVRLDGTLPEIGFEYAPDDPLPRWPDDRHPQQIHLDIEVADVDASTGAAVAWGATVLRDLGADHRILADPIGHPFCLRRGTDGSSGRIARVVLDCFSPRTLARFYADLLDLDTWVLDTPDRVEVTGGDLGLVLAFQQSDADPPRWPDPTRPAQLHFDMTFEDHSTPERLERLGAVRRELDARPDNLVFADPAGHPMCIGLGGWGRRGLDQARDYEEWLASQ